MRLRKKWIKWRRCFRENGGRALGENQTSCGVAKKANNSYLVLEDGFDKTIEGGHAWDSYFDFGMVAFVAVVYEFFVGKEFLRNDS